MRPTLAFTLSALSWQFLKANGSVDGQKQNKEGASMKLPAPLVVTQHPQSSSVCLAFPWGSAWEERASSQIDGDQPALPRKHPTVLFWGSSTMFICDVCSEN